ncbi:MAG TPA: hypothetical protein VHO69_09875, partial [Phototrophicaceae bacterium]|nr:hypothetical protein [Phototrophicaceae bacterium]
IMDTEKHPQFTFSDAWLLFSVAAAETPQGGTLAQIMAVGDMIDHSIFSGPELRRGFAKLIHVGYIQEIGNNFSLSGQAKDYWAALATDRKAKSLGKKFEKVQSFLGPRPLPSADPRVDDPEWPYPALTDEIVKAAYQQYTGQNQG